MQPRTWACLPAFWCEGLGMAIPGHQEWQDGQQSVPALGTLLSWRALLNPGLPGLHLSGGEEGMGWGSSVLAAPWPCVFQAVAMQGTRLVLAVGARMG